MRGPPEVTTSALTDPHQGLVLIAFGLAWLVLTGLAISVGLAAGRMARRLPLPRAAAARAAGCPPPGWCGADGSVTWSWYRPRQRRPRLAWRRCMPGARSCGKCADFIAPIRRASATSGSATSALTTLAHERPDLHVLSLPLHEVGLRGSEDSPGGRMTPRLRAPRLYAGVPRQHKLVPRC